MSQLDVVVVNYNAGVVLSRCLNSVLDHPAVANVTLVDNGSQDNSLEFAEVGRVDALIQLPNNPGFATACNRGAGQGAANWLVFLNPDAWFEPGALDRLAAVLGQQSSAGLFGVEVLNEAGQRQRATVRSLPALPQSASELRGLITGGASNDLAPVSDQGPRVVPAVSGACMVVRRRAFEELGGFDQGFRLHGEDLDLMRRLHDTNWQIMWLPEVVVRHVQGVSSRARPAWVHWQKHRSMLRYLGKHELPQRGLLTGALARAGVVVRFLLTLPGVLVSRH